MPSCRMPRPGYEKGMTNLLAAQAGGNLIYESAGMHASLLGCCFESFVIDNDMLGAILRTVRGIEVTDDSLSIGAMREVCLGGPGHFLGHEQTLELMQSGVSLSRGRRPLEPEGMGRARRRWTFSTARESAPAALLAEHYPAHIDPRSTAQIRARFPIRLPRRTCAPATAAGDRALRGALAGGHWRALNQLWPSGVNSWGPEWTRGRRMKVEVGGFFGLLILIADMWAIVNVIRQPVVDRRRRCYGRADPAAAAGRLSDLAGRGAADGRQSA